MTKPVAVIVGAGIAGLSAAWWLDKAGWTSVVVERDDALRASGYSMTISGLGHETVQHMDLLAELQSVSQHFEYNIISDGYGRELCRIRYVDVHGGGLEALPVRRDELARLLAKHLPSGASIRFRETVREFADQGDKVRVVLAGGDTIEADLLIGADGFRSQIRRSLWKGREDDFLEHLGYYYAAYNFSNQQTESQQDHDCYSFNRPGQLDMLFSLRDKGLTCMNIWREERDLSTTGTSKEAKFDILRQVTAQSVPQVRDAVEQAEQADALVTLDSLTLVTLPRWSEGRVLLLGDAAHCLTLLSGQGAGMALVSAEILAKELQKDPDDVLAALRNHEAKLRPAIERLQARSKRMADMFIPKSSLAYYFRNLVLKVLPYSWIVGFHVSSVKSEIDLT
ncbi:hypothetical protein AYO20_04386 [Fonsecaea nubica]|uniref:FAD-binding domain-containing protein n=1 Tax=Fonsecaea nubica TaxID=856822 RepID=A0A178D282_9EURO|nr:hypothetical protein AYO20_04386 [Fonsecaea nubica]OAL36228.1 hypothetical protein AYO20_04386 [Fonsecaea nubica]